MLKFLIPIPMTVFRCDKIKDHELGRLSWIILMSIYIHEGSEKTEEWGLKSLLEKEMWWGKHVIREE